MSSSDNVQVSVNYHKFKIRIKLWESSFIEKHRRKPNKNDIKAADPKIREAYSMYWKLKTEVLEKTTTKIPLTSTRQNLIEKSNLNLMKESTQNINDLEDKKFQSPNILIKNNNSYFSTFSHHNRNSDQYKKKPHGILPQDFNIDHCSINDNGLLTKSPFQLSEKVFVDFPTQNLRKSITKSTSSCTEKISDHLDNLDINFKNTLNQAHINYQHYKSSYAKKESLYNQKNTFQQVIKSDSKINHKEVNPKVSTKKSSNYHFLNFQNNVKEYLLSEINQGSLIPQDDFVINKRKRSRNQEDESCNENFQPYKKTFVDLDSNTKNNLCSNESLTDDSKYSHHTVLLLTNENNIKENVIKNSQLLEICQNHDSKIVRENDVSDICSKNDDEMSNTYNEVHNVLLTTSNTITNTEEMNLDSQSKNHISEEFLFADKVHENHKRACLNEKPFNTKTYTEKKGNFTNTNFVRINLKKKLYVRGSKSFNFSRYKKKKNLLLKKYTNNHKDHTKCSETSREAREMQHTENCLSLKHKSMKHISNSFLALDSLNKNNFNLPKLQETNQMHSKNFKEQIFNLQNQDKSKLFFTENQFKKSELLLTGNSEKKSGVIENEYKCHILKANPIYELESDGSTKDTPLEVLLALKKFGHKEFRDGQEKAIMRILSGQSTLLTLATGSGKSLCYQLPAYIYSKKEKCITLVISPLVSLMNDQVSEIPNFLKAACIHSNQSFKLRQSIVEDLRNGKLNILLISPETLVSEDTSNNLGTLFREFPPIAFACIDEVHCISQWSHSFRPSYLMVCNVLREKLGVNTFLGLTATANITTVKNIVSVLNIQDETQGVISCKSLPPNLILTISRDQRKEEALLKFLDSERFHKSDSIIIYCTRRDECTKLATFLRTSLVRDNSYRISDMQVRKANLKISPIAEAYHAGLSASKRKAIQKSFMKSDTRIIVATVAFGMGINKTNIRSVIHFNMPASLEHYVQEIGRAGRDGIQAHCHLFLNSEEHSDTYELQRHINAKSIDRYTIKQLLKKIFISCNCHKQNKSRCSGHEVVFPVNETVKTLDVSEEMITTLLYYLELQPKNCIKVLPLTHIIAKITSNDGNCVIERAAKTLPSSIDAIDLLKKKKINYDSNSTIEFSIPEVAQVIGWNIEKLINHLKNLEMITNETNISVTFHTLGFRIKAPGHFNEEQLEEVLQSLYEENSSYVNLCHRQLYYFSNLCRQFSYDSINECLVLSSETYLQSEKLKNNIRKYFENEVLCDVSLPLEQVSITNEQKIVESVRNLVRTYQDVNFTGRTVAHIFHGIPTPNISAIEWSKTRFWRAYMDVNFNILCQIANREILGIQ